MKITEKQKEDAEKYNTDKFGFSDKWNSHTYGEFYDELFQGSENEPLNVLEIGIYFGGSVRLFHDYLKKSNVYCIDIFDRWTYEHIEEYDRLKRYFFNAYDLSKWDELPVKKFNVIVEDGPHTYDTQLYSLNNFTPFLSWGGILAIEDVQTLHIDNLINNCTCDKSKLAVFRGSDSTIVTGDNNIIYYTNV